MANLHSITTITRKTIADGDALNNTITASVDNDTLINDALVQTLNSANAVQEHVAKNEAAWNNDNVHNFGTIDFSNKRANSSGCAKLCIFYQYIVAQYQGR